VIDRERVGELRQQGASWRAIAQQLGVSQAGVRKAAAGRGESPVHTPDGRVDASAGSAHPVGPQSRLSVDPAEPPRSRMAPIPGARSWAEGVSLKQDYPCVTCRATIAIGERHAVRIDGRRPRPRLCIGCHDQHAIDLVGLPLQGVDRVRPRKATAGGAGTVERLDQRRAPLATVSPPSSSDAEAA